MIKKLYSNGRYAPVIICDVCGKRIEDARHGAVASKSDPVEGQMVDVMYVHKGGCHDAADAMLEASGSSTGWTELSHHFLYLAHNVGLDLEALKELDELLNKFGDP